MSSVKTSSTTEMTVEEVKAAKAKIMTKTGWQESDQRATWESKLDTLINMNRTDVLTHAKNICDKMSGTFLIKAVSNIINQPLGRAGIGNATDASQKVFSARFNDSDGKLRVLLPENLESFADDSFVIGLATFSTEVAWSDTVEVDYTAAETKDRYKTANSKELDDYWTGFWLEASNVDGRLAPAGKFKTTDRKTDYTAVGCEVFRWKLIRRILDRQDIPDKMLALPDPAFFGGRFGDKMMTSYESRYLISQYDAKTADTILGMTDVIVDWISKYTQHRFREISKGALKPFSFFHAGNKQKTIGTKTVEVSEIKAGKVVKRRVEQPITVSATKPWEHMCARPFEKKMLKELYGGPWKQMNLLQTTYLAMDPRVIKYKEFNDLVRKTANLQWEYTKFIRKQMNNRVNQLIVPDPAKPGIRFTMSQKVSQYMALSLNNIKDLWAKKEYIDAHDPWFLCHTRQNWVFPEGAMTFGEFLNNGTTREKQFPETAELFKKFEHESFDWYNEHVMKPEGDAKKLLPAEWKVCKTFPYQYKIVVSTKDLQSMLDNLPDATLQKSDWSREAEAWDDHHKKVTGQDGAWKLPPKQRVAKEGISTTQIDDEITKFASKFTALEGLAEADEEDEPTTSKQTKADKARAKAEAKLPKTSESVESTSLVSGIKKNFEPEDDLHNTAFSGSTALSPKYNYLAESGGKPNAPSSPSSRK